MQANDGTVGSSISGIDADQQIRWLVLLCFVVPIVWKEVI